MFTRTLSLMALLAPLGASQSIGGSGQVPSGAGLTPNAHPARELPKPDGTGTFFADGHRNGRASSLFLEEVRVGRLVEVHGLDASGALDPAPAFRDLLIGETIQSDGSGYLLYTSPSTQVAHLVVLREPGAPEPSPGAGTFADLVRAAERAAPVVPPRAPGALFVASVPRNGALSLRFSDLLADDASAAGHLPADVQVRVGSALDLPFEVRTSFDPNHGGIAGGAFHSTRVLLDTTVTSFEALESPVPIPVNGLGLPPGPNLSQASVLLRLPTRVDPGSGQFSRLENLAGRGLARSENGPIDLGSPSLDLVRAARAANDLDPNTGFLLDLEAPRALGVFGVSVTQAQPDPAGTPGHAFLVDWTFQGPCAGRPRLGDALQRDDLTLELVENGPDPDPSGSVQNVRVRLAQRAPTSVGALLGSGVLVARVRANASNSACWFQITPQPAFPPGDGLATSAQFGVRFSEAMRSDSIDPYDAFRLVQGPPGVTPDALNTVVAQVQSTADRTQVVLTPSLPLAHVQGEATRYHIELVAGSGGPTDLAGNPLEVGPSAELRVARSAPSETSAGIVLRFASVDEVPGPGIDLRGNLFHDFGAETIRGRPATHFSVVADQVNPVPSLMIPFPPGVQAPLSPFGSKLHSVWRYCDLGWSVRDETKYDLDVVGIDWAPTGGLVISDFFPGFEIRLAHASRLPDEAVDNNLLPRWPASGLVGSNGLFTDNILEDPLSPQKIVHPRALGYSVNPAHVFTASSGTTMIPYPLNQGPGTPESYTWRDTSVLAQDGPSGAGVPMDIEVGPPLFLEPQVGTVAGAEDVPSIGLPLLLEYRCYPTDLGLGLNSLAVSLAINSSALPAFRSFSMGGFNAAGNGVAKDPDLQLSPSGGFNPQSTPPGLPTPARDNVSYIGQLDLVVRVSRVHSAWFDTGAASPDYALLDLGTLSEGLSPGSMAGVTAEVRGATGFVGTGGSENDAAQLDAYGDLAAGTATFLNGDATWHGTPDEIDGARYVQVRLTLANDVARGESPILGHLALAFQR